MVAYFSHGVRLVSRLYRKKNRKKIGVKNDLQNRTSFFTSPAQLGQVKNERLLWGCCSRHQDYLLRKVCITGHCYSVDLISFFSFVYLLNHRNIFDQLVGIHGIIIVWP